MLLIVIGFDSWSVAGAAAAAVGPRSESAAVAADLDSCADEPQSSSMSEEWTWRPLQRDEAVDLVVDELLQQRDCGALLEADDASKVIVVFDSEAEVLELAEQQPLQFEADSLRLLLD